MKCDKVGGTCDKHGEEENCIYGYWGNVKGRNHLEDLGADGRIFRTRGGRACTELMWFRLENIRRLR
jgi:hypothetical protein